ncbi:hypothetical protein MKEN_00653400 [Mycena kentingensis (nom. inval.)]|nr:hypothetical protein MKEN_00653400 [Mycena kentingensis (nom. inval.)]
MAKEQSKYPISLPTTSGKANKLRVRHNRTGFAWLLTTMVSVIALLALAAIACAQSNAVTPHSVSNVALPNSPVSVNGLSLVAKPTADPGASAHGVSLVNKPTNNAVSAHGVSSVDAPGGALTLSWTSTVIPLPTNTASASTSSNKGKVAGGVVGGVAVLVAAIGAVIFVRLRRRSSTHWRNRTDGQWNQQGKAETGQVYVGRPLSQSYGHDVKAPIASPTTAAPIFVREPRLRNDNADM